MMKKIVALLLVMLPLLAIATEQYPDRMIIDGKEYNLAVSWAFQSPLQIYYQRTATRSPFRSWSTANYRGHIATWEVRNDTLYLLTVDTKQYFGRTGSYFPGEKNPIDTTAAPGYFGIQSLGPHATQPDSAVVADWFSGTFTASNGQEPTHFYYVVRGVVIDHQAIGKKDFKRMHKMRKRDRKDETLMAKYLIVLATENYCNFYFRSVDKEHVVFNGHKGVLDQAEGCVSTLMGYYDNDPVNFPFHWNRFDTVGTPNCQWELKDDTLLLTGVSLHSGSGFYEYDSLDIPLSRLFGDKVRPDGKVLASWVNGERVLEYGHLVQVWGSPRLQADWIQHVVFEKGIVAQSRFVPRGFDDPEPPTLHTVVPDYSDAVYRSDNLYDEKFTNMPKAQTPPTLLNTEEELKAYFATHTIDTSYKGRGYGGRIYFMVDTLGHISQPELQEDGVQGRRAEVGLLALDVLRQTPLRFKPATNEKGEPVVCWRRLSMYVHDGIITLEQ